MDIVVWLRSLGLRKYEAAFRENKIDETVLPSLTDEHLKELGVTALGHRVAFCMVARSRGRPARKGYDQCRSWPPRKMRYKSSAVTPIIFLTFLTLACALGQSVGRTNQSAVFADKYFVANAGKLNHASREAIQT